MREGLLDNKQYHNINNNNNIRILDQKVPLKNEKIPEMVINIENNLSEGDNNKKDDNKEKEAKENPIGINIGR